MRERIRLPVMFGLPAKEACAEQIVQHDHTRVIPRYLDHAGLEEGWLVLFDLRKGLLWEDKLFVREVAHEGKRVRIVGC